MKKKFGSFVVDASCILSLVGIWPRFIEPKRLKKTRLNIPLQGVKSLKIIHLTDLHFHQLVTDSFLKKIIHAVQEEQPDLLFFTGDFICFSELEEKNRLEQFLAALRAPYGTFCTFGNHDYATYVTRDRHGNYVCSQPINPFKGMCGGFLTLFQRDPPIGEVKEELPLHAQLVTLLANTPFTLLENKTITLPIGLNVVGLGDYAAGSFKPDLAFQGYKNEYPGIVLTHNPDTFPRLKPYPGDLILAGHSHGEQIHFPYPPFLRKFSQKLTRLEYPAYSRGFFRENGKMLYVNRGIGCHKPVRLFSPPEILVLTTVPHD